VQRIFISIGKPLELERIDFINFCARCYASKFALSTLYFTFYIIWVLTYKGSICISFNKSWYYFIKLFGIGSSELKDPIEFLINVSVSFISLLWIGWSEKEFPLSYSGKTDFLGSSVGESDFYEFDAFMVKVKV
jgi:hypothetical protein